MYATGCRTTRISPSRFEVSSELGCIDIVRHRLDFDPPADTAFFVSYGFEAQFGLWAELLTPDQPQPIAGYNAMGAEYRHDRPLVGMLHWLAHFGAFSPSELEEWLTAWESPERV